MLELAQIAAAQSIPLALHQLGLHGPASLRGPPPTCLLKGFAQFLLPDLLNEAMPFGSILMLTAVPTVVIVSSPLGP